MNEEDATLNSIKNTLNLCLEITATTQDPYRIIGTFGRAVTLTNNYSLSATLLSKGSDQYTIDESDSYYGTDNLDGANIAGGDKRAKANPFYETVLKWDFTNKWTFDKNFDYPILKLFSTEPTYIEDENPGTGVNIYLSDNILLLDKLPVNSIVSVYTISGQKIISKTVSGNFSFTLPEKDVYIVNIEYDGKSSAYKLLNR